MDRQTVRCVEGELACESERAASGLRRTCVSGVRCGCVRMSELCPVILRASLSVCLCLSVCLGT